MKKGQVWQFDFLIAIVLATITIALFIQFALSQNNSSDFSDLSTVATGMSESLMSEGLPTDWNLSTIRAIGILGENGRIDQTKIELFYNMTPNEYRVLLNQRHFYRIELTQNNIPLTIVNKTYVGFDDVNATSSLTVTRFVLYNSTITKLEVTIWE